MPPSSRTMPIPNTLKCMLTFSQVDSWPTQDNIDGPSVTFHLDQLLIVTQQLRPFKRTSWTPSAAVVAEHTNWKHARACSVTQPSLSDTTNMTKIRQYYNLMLLKHGRIRGNNSKVFNTAESNKATTILEGGIKQSPNSMPTKTCHTHPIQEQNHSKSKQASHDRGPSEVGFVKPLWH